MNPAAPLPCAKTDAVLALHLDGDFDGPGDGTHGYTFVDSDSLHDHLRQCASCQTTLRRARRLDAALASGAGAACSEHERRPGSSWPELQQRWFAAVASAAPAPSAAPAAVSSAPATRPRLATRPAAVVSGAAAMVTLLCWLASRSDGARLDVQPPEPRVAAAESAAVIPPAVIPAAVPPAAVPPVAALAAAPTASASAAPLLPAADAVPYLLRHRGAPASPNAADAGARQESPLEPEQLAARLADPACPAAERCAATRSLVLACRPLAPASEGALRSLLLGLAACGAHDDSPAAHNRQLECVRESPHTRSLLANSLLDLDAPGRHLTRGDVAALVVATRLGGTELDTLVRRVCRRHADGIEVVAAALRCGARATGGAALLLDVWQDLGSRGAAADDADTARELFGGQPAALFDELRGQIRSSRVDARRLHGLLALGASSDGSTVLTLLEYTRSRHIDEAHTAAFALSCLPRACLAPIVQPAGLDENFLLRAALARAGHEAARPWIEALSLRLRELQLLQTAPLARFPEVASWFRERGTASD